MDVRDDHTGSTSTVRMDVNGAQVEELILENQWLKIWDLFAALESSIGTVHNIAHESWSPIYNQHNF